MKPLPNPVLEDDSISLKAKMILSIIHALNGASEVTIRDFAEWSADGKYSVRSGFDELRDAGYLRTSKRRNEDGTIIGTEYHLYLPEE